MFDPYYWNDKVLSDDAWAQEQGYEDYEDYLISIDDEELEGKLEL